MRPTSPDTEPTLHAQSAQGFSEKHGSLQLPHAFVLQCCCRFSTAGSGLNSSDALIQDHYSKEVTASYGPVSGLAEQQQQRLWQWL
jgi:hypothetical protein